MLALYILVFNIYEYLILEVVQRVLGECNKHTKKMLTKYSSKET
jgi:hypothetical protein